jgi:peptidoglycan/xylan/chitin deacetylase (PgdA/CDA1 family)
MRPTEPTGEDFAALLGWVAHQFRVLSLTEAIYRLRARSLPSRALVITFDDGYADNVEVAAPILRRYGLPAIFFVATGFLDGGRPFIDTLIDAAGEARQHELDLTGLGLGYYRLDTLEARRRASEELIARVKQMDGEDRDRTASQIALLAGVTPSANLMMTSRQLQKLAHEGFEIGAHTVTHPILARLSAQAAAAEVRNGRDRLVELIDRPVNFFAYPNGRPGKDYSAQTVAIVRQLGFEAALTTAPGVSTADTDLFQLPRFTPWDRTALRFSMRLIHNLTNSRPATASIPSSVTLAERTEFQKGLHSD